MRYSFREFLALDEETQKALGNPPIYEELNQKIKNKKMKELEKMLKDKDWWWFMSDDGREYKKGKSEEDKIKALRDLIGDDAQILYKQYAIKAGVMESRDDISPSTRASIKRYMTELETLMKKHNWHWNFDPDRTKVKEGKKIEEQIRELVIEIKELGSSDGWELYLKYAKKNKVKIPYFEDKSKPIPTDYEKHMMKVMKSYGITHPDQLADEENGNEALKRFWKEVDDTWKGNSDVKVNLPKSRNEGLFAEMNNVEGRGTLDYADRQVGDKSITASSFCDAGNLYENTPTWQAPSPHRKRGWHNK